MCLFVSHLRYICLIQGYLVSPKSPIASVLKVRYKIQCELIFCMWCQKRFELNFFLLRYSTVPEKNLLKSFSYPTPLELPCHLFQKSSDHAYVVLFLDFIFFLLIYTSILTWMPCYLDLYNFVVNLIIWRFRYFRFILLSNCFCSSESFTFHINFRIRFSISTVKNLLEIWLKFHGICVSIWGILTYFLGLSLQEHSLFLHLFDILVSHNTVL